MNSVQELGSTFGVAALGTLVLARGFGPALLVASCLVGLASITATLMLPRRAAVPEPEPLELRSAVVDR